MMLMMIMKSKPLVLQLLSLHILGVFFLSYSPCLAAEYYVGTGIADITGPCVEVNFAGYGSTDQTGEGIHLREFSRAFIFATSPTSDRVVFVNLDIAWATGSIKREVVKKLQSKYGSVYSDKNVCITSNHGHGSVAGYTQFVLYDLNALGFNEQNFNAIVNGAVESITRAHDSMKAADIYVNTGELSGTGVNRSPKAYLANPESERARYNSDMDTEMLVLKIVSDAGEAMGMISWFPVHCTSMRSNNTLLTSDNKGYAQILFETEFNPGALPGQGSFVAAFAQANEGDVSPNTGGTRCEESGDECDGSSACPIFGEECIAYGPGADDEESTKIIARKQYEKAKELYNAATTKLTGPVDFRHSFVDMSSYAFTLEDGSQVSTCKPAMGYSFASGTTDGPGLFFVQQGTTDTNAFFETVKGFISTPSTSQDECHSPKPILLNSGEISRPYLWQANIVGTQLLRLGQLVIIPMPGEPTTMAGRRMKESIKNTLVSEGFPADTIPVISGLSNEYGNYITTFEEYQLQLYEGASTSFGSHTLSAYLQIYNQLAEDMAKGQTSAEGPTPPHEEVEQISAVLDVILDTAPLFKDFGDVLDNAKSSYERGSKVSVTFVSANPRNDLRTGDTFLTVERKVDGEWVVQYTDAHWETKFKWIRTNILTGTSKAKISWDIPLTQATGKYRIRHFGNEKSLSGKISSFTGKSRSFTVK